MEGRARTPTAPGWFAVPACLQRGRSAGRARPSVDLAFLSGVDITVNRNVWSALLNNKYCYCSKY